MISQAARFPIFIAVTLAVFVAILLFVTRKRANRPSHAAIAGVAVLVVVGGMLFAKFGNNAGWPWWIYYTVPAAITLLLPPLAFHLSKAELWQYLLLAFLSSPLIHIAFSVLAGWHDYMPFLEIPSVRKTGG
jgi:hypothetical protein